MKTTYCNPLDLGYRYQHMKEGPRTAGFREGADPTLVYFKGKYYLRFWLSICRTSLAVSALRIMRYCPKSP